jgi:uncharacterized protein (DUF2249 family)/hemerythrin-like domain-containing protein
MSIKTTGSQQATEQAIRDHHERLGRTMTDHAVTIRRAIDQLSGPSERQARLLAFCAEEVLPHAVAEEETLYRTAEDLPSAHLLVRAMRREHAILRDLVGALESARTPGEVASAAGALNALFHAHLEKENDLLLPALVNADVDLGALLAGMHSVLGEPAEEHHCTCGGHDDPGTPGATATVVDGELDVRTLVPAQRHEQIFATFEALEPGTAFVLVNDHDPKPLYYQFAAEHTGRFTWDYLESGPQLWRVRIGRP